MQEHASLKMIGMIIDYKSAPIGAQGSVNSRIPNRQNDRPTGGYEGSNTSKIMLYFYIYGLYISVAYADISQMRRKDLLTDVH